MLQALSRHRDTVRIVVQTAAACALTWYAVHWAGLGQNTSWGLISTLLVVQASLDDTMQATGFRVLATLLGTVLGIASIWILPAHDMTLLRVVLAAVVVNALGMRWPGLRFGIVPGTILVLSPGQGIVDAALPRALAIVVGALAGFVAASVVWPDRSRSRALREVGRALDAARELLDFVLGDSREDPGPRLERIHASFLGHLQGARGAAGGAKVGRRLKTGRPVTELPRELERLWHGLIILERVLIEDAFNLPRDALAQVRPAMQEIRGLAGETIESVQGSLAEGAPREEFRELAARLQAARQHVQQLSGSLAGSRTPHSERALGTLLFGLDEVARHLVEILDTLLPGAAETEGGRGSA